MDFIAQAVRRRMNERHTADERPKSPPKSRVRVEAPEDQKPIKLPEGWQEHVPLAKIAQKPATTLGSEMELRQDQVTRMSAGAKVEPTIRGQWPLPSSKTLSVFQGRHEALKTFSGGYMQTQERLLFLFDHAPESRFAAFELECYKRALAPTTAHSYWTAFAGVDKMLSDVLGATPAVRRCSQVLEDRALQYPVAFPQPLTGHLRQRLRDTVGPENACLHVLIEACWILGQRFGDFVQLAVNDFLVKEDKVLITFRRGKTVSYTKPYTLTLSRAHPIVEALLQIRANAQKMGWLFLVTPKNESELRQSLLRKASAHLSTVDERLEVRSIRRGGLQHMASLGMTTDEIRDFSKHTSNEMLMRYLAWGQVALEHNTRIQALADRMLAEC